MKDSACRGVSVLAAVTMLSASVFAGCATEDPCALLAVKLSELAILDARPESAVAAESAHDCDSSDDYSYAWRSYRSPTPRTEVVAFYEAALLRAGWWARPNPAVPPGTTRAGTGLSCYFTKVDNRFAQFFIDSSGSETDSYTVRVEGPSPDSCQET